jgi:IclR family pca regulon transcriptional regulator
MIAEPHEKSKDFVQSMERGFAIMKAFNEENPRLTLSEVAELTGFTRATARRFLLTLESLNYVGSTGRHFFLRPKVLELGFAFLSSYNLVSISQNHLEALANELRESCSASALEGENVIYICRAATNRIMTVNLSVGHSLPAYATSMGRVLLAAMSDKELDNFMKTFKRPKLTSRTITDAEELKKVILQVRKQGWAVNEQELEEGVQSVAVPVHDKSGNIVIAVNVSAHASRVPIERLVNEFLPKLQKCAREIEEDSLLQS